MLAKVRASKTETHKKFYRKEDHYNWKGGISRDPYAFEFDNILKAKIRERDGYKCMFCGAPQEEFENKLPVHHIDYNKKNCSVFNLITLCLKCNTKANYGRKKWQSYFESQIKQIYNKIETDKVSIWEE